MSIAALDSGDFLSRLERYWHSAPMKELARRHGISVSTVKAHRAGLGLAIYVRALGVLKHVQDDSRWRASALEEEIHALRHQVIALTEKVMGEPDDLVGEALAVHTDRPARETGHRGIEASGASGRGAGR